MRRIAAAIALMTCFAAPAAEAADVVRLSYDVTLAGLPAGEIDVEATIAADGYRLTSVTRSVGVMDWLIGFRSTVESRGALQPAGPAPAFHSADNIWRGEARTVRIAFDGPRVLRADVAPTREAEEREPIPQALIDRSLDPLSAGLGLALAATRSAPACAGEAAIFDGRRTYDIALSGGTEDRVSSDGYAGASLRCDLTYERTGGRSPEPWIAGAHAPQQGALWLGRLGARLPLAPVRIEADAGIGTMVLSLRASEACSEGACLRHAAAE